jgi:hypothetical protein
MTWNWPIGRPRVNIQAVEWNFERLDIPQSRPPNLIPKAAFRHSYWPSMVQNTPCRLCSIIW